MQQLGRKLSFADTTALYVGVILGSGIFVAPQWVAKAGWGVWPWVIGGLVSMAGGLCYAECGARIPDAGGFFTFYRRAFGDRVAFLGGWAAVVLTYPCSYAAIAWICAQYAQALFPALNMTITAIGVIVLNALFNGVGLLTGPRVQRFLTPIKVAALAALCLAAGSAQPVAPEPSLDFQWSNGVVAAMVVMWTFDGWSNIGLLAGEVRTPKRDLYRAVIWGTAAITLLYVIVQLAIEHVLTSQAAASSSRVFSDALEVALGERAQQWVSVLVVICTFGAVGSSMFAGARVGYAMGRDAHLPRVLSTLHATWNTPVVALMVMSGLSILFLGLGSFDALLAFFTASVWGFYGLVGVAVWVLRRRRLGDPGRLPLRWLSPWVLVIASLGMAVAVAQQRPWEAAGGIAIILAAFPVFAYFRVKSA